MIAASAFGSEAPTDLGRLASPAEMAAATADLWGDESRKPPDGPSYAFFQHLLPPLRYVNTAFRHYPVVLSAPAARLKARWVSNGAGVNLRAEKPPMWKEIGVPLSIHVGEGDHREPFGADPARLDGPRCRNGYLPMVAVGYTSRGVTYQQEVFAAVDEPFASRGAVFLRFTTGAGAGTVTAALRADPPLVVEAADRAVRDGSGRSLLLHDGSWTWDRETRQLRSRVEAGASARLVVLTEPMPDPGAVLDSAGFPASERRCEEVWTALVGRGTQLAIPESIVQDAWRALVAGQFLIADGDRMNYSAGNAYDHLYEAECGDAVRSLLLWGYVDEARRMVKPLLDFNRQATRFHVAGHKLQLLADYYWLTRDEGSLRGWEPTWRPVIDFLLQSRRPDNGLLPPDRYAGDIAQDVYSLNSNANAWRGLHNMAAVLKELGDDQKSQRLEVEARSFRKAILQAVDASEARDVEPMFIPNALFGVEKPYSILTATRLGSYYDLMAPYILGSRVFGPGDRRETAMIDYLRIHGGIALGMIRSTPHQGEFDNEPGVNPLYGLRYQLALLRRDDREHALVGFYGQLAQGMTRGTFIGGEGSRFLHGDAFGRSFYLPPNSASNATFLATLRYLLIQDWDLDDDGRPETLRLLYGIPPRWLADGSVLEAARAPTAFGPLSLRVESRLRDGELRLEILAPSYKPAAFTIRPRLPSGYRAVAASLAGRGMTIAADGSLDLSGTNPSESIRVRVRVERVGD
jgi:hypothetical protein